MTNGTDNQILAAYRDGKTADFIAEDMGFPLYAVKAKLMSLSSEYRKSCGAESQEEDELNFSREEQMLIKRELLSLAMSTEDDHLKGKLLINLRDDGKGRKDVVKNMGNAIGTMNILQLVNGGIQQAREGSRRLKDTMSQRVIEAS